MSQFITCPYCKAIIPEDSNYCPHCSTKLKEVKKNETSS